VSATLVFLAAAYALQRSFRQFPGEEYKNFPLPPDSQEKTEWAFARLMYPSVPGADHARRGADWREGRTSWTNDYPRADRHFSQAVRRLTRIHTRSVEQPVNLDDGDEVFNWPWLYAVQVGEWKLTEAQARKLREYLLRGGFFMADDFWGTSDWAVFEASVRRVFPDRPIVELGDFDSIYHTVYDLDERCQVPAEGAWRAGRSYRKGGFVPHWMGIYDDYGRLMVAISYNSDLGDSWEWADAPHYPERFASLGIRIGVNYVVYAMTH
jgi:hypothetical protein